MDIDGGLAGNLRLDVRAESDCDLRPGSCGYFQSGSPRDLLRDLEADPPGDLRGGSERGSRRESLTDFAPRRDSPPVRRLGHSG
jgi:hypothetical protein